ncbi:MAG: hypothetical protein J1G05_01025 [Clostridiales bacterium]|nr:hypothetical protein [Clostridiales bacterium]
MQNKAKLVRLYFGIFLSLLTLTVGILFIVQACGIFADAGYVQGGYTPETIGTRFLYICAPFFIWIAAIIAGFVLSLVYPVQPKKSALSNNPLALKRLTSKIPEGSGEGYDANLKTVKKERLTRFITAIALTVILIVCIIISCIYLFNKSNFKGIPAHDAMFNMFKFVGPFVLASLACAVIAVVITKLSINKELNAVKSLIANGKGAPVRTDMRNPVDKITDKVRAKAAVLTNKKTSNIIRICVVSALGVLAVTFIILGVFNGGIYAVWLKAKEICTECIGLG